MDKTKLPEIEAKKLRELLEKDFQSCIEEVTEAVNTTRTGLIIDDSEELVRMATASLRQKIFQKALQMKTDAAQAAFSSSTQKRRKKQIPP